MVVNRTVQFECLRQAIARLANDWQGGLGACPQVVGQGRDFSASPPSLEYTVITEHEECSVITFPDWVTAIFKKEKVKI